MPDETQRERYCRCCGKVYPSKRSHSETCSASCRKRVNRALKAKLFFEWGTLMRYIIPRRPPGLGVRRIAKLNRGNFSNNPKGKNGHEKTS